MTGLLTSTDSSLNFIGRPNCQSLCICAAVGCRLAVDRQTERLPGPKAHLLWPLVSYLMPWNFCCLCLKLAKFRPNLLGQGRSDWRTHPPINLFSRFLSKGNRSLTDCLVVIVQFSCFEIFTVLFFPHYYQLLWSVSLVTLCCCYFFRIRRHYRNNAMTSLLFFYLPFEVTNFLKPQSWFSCLLPSNKWIE